MEHTDDAIVDLGYFVSGTAPDNNKYSLYFSNGVIHCSYGKPVVVKLGGKIFLTNYHNYSKTTAKHRNQFLNTDSKSFKESDYDIIAVN